MVHGSHRNTRRDGSRRERTDNCSHPLIKPGCALECCAEEKSRINVSLGLESSSSSRPGGACVFVCVFVCVCLVTAP